MFEFTKRSRKVLEVLAQTEARRLNSDSLGPEHIMMALLNDEDSVAARIMKNIGVNFDVLRKELEETIKETGSTIILGSIPIGPKYKRVIEISKEEAKKLKNSYIGTEHLLLALFREGSLSGISSLSSSGTDYNIVRNEILRVLGVKLNTEKANPRVKTEVKQPILDEFTRDLTKMAQENLLDPVIGRADEITRVIRILSRKRKNNPVLIGEAGVGKTAIVEGLAQAIVKKQVPDSLQNYRLLSIDMAGIVAGTKYRGEFEDRLKKIVKEIQASNDIIVFIDEIHTIAGAGAAEGAIDAANILKPVLARGEFQCIGATTLNEYRLYLEKDAALARRFQTVFVDEPGIEDSIEILKGLREKYEEHHKVEYEDEALEKAVYLSRRYINDRFLPDKAIDVIDEAGAMARLDNHDLPTDILMIEHEIDELNSRKNELVFAQEYEQAASVRDLIIEKKEIMAAKLEDWKEKRNDYVILVSASRISEVISESTGIPIKELESTETEKLINMEAELHKRVVGQEKAIEAVSRAIRRSRLGIGKANRPKGSFIFLGPTGVGKTELARSLAEFLFADEKNMVRLDMSEYMEKHSVAKLIGAPPGYVGYEEGGQLTEKIRRRPYAIVLFDEIEKAHPDVFNLLLQVLEEGELTTSSGSTVSFRDTIIILTSNIGSRFYENSSRLGFIDYADENDHELIDEELKKAFPPELLNRIDEIIHFHKLEKKHFKSIVEIMLNTISEDLSRNRIFIDFSAGVKKHFSEMGFSEMYGARNLRRLIQRELEDELAVEIMKSGRSDNLEVSVIMRGKGLHFRIHLIDENGKDKKEAVLPGGSVGS